MARRRSNDEDDERKNYFFQSSAAQSHDKRCAFSFFRYLIKISKNPETKTAAILQLETQKHEKQRTVDSLAKI